MKDLYKTDMDWTKTGLLSGLSEDDSIVMTSMLNKLSKIVVDESIKFVLYPILRRCFNQSGITDVEWIVNDFVLWEKENKEMLERLYAHVYMKLDASFEMCAMYSDIHGNRYLKYHKIKSL